jgi:hypothetical protein
MPRHTVMKIMQTMMNLSKDMRMDQRPKSTTRTSNFKITAKGNKMTRMSDNLLEKNSKERRDRKNYAIRSNKIS